MNIPATCKKLTSFIRRAEELDRDASGREETKVVAYFCRFYAADLAIKMPNKTKDDNDFLIALLDKLEADKANLSSASIAEGKEICTAFALDVFQRADEEDSLGLSNKETAKTFNAAGNFFDILSQFGNVDSECLDKKKFAKVKALDILKALKEGREPTPGLSDFVRSQPAYSENLPFKDENKPTSVSTSQPFAIPDNTQELGFSDIKSSRNELELTGQDIKPSDNEIKDISADWVVTDDSQISHSTGEDFSRDDYNYNTQPVVPSYSALMDMYPMTDSWKEPSIFNTPEHKNIPACSTEKDLSSAHTSSNQSLHKPFLHAPMKSEKKLKLVDSSSNPIENIRRALLALDHKDIASAKILIQDAIGQL